MINTKLFDQAVIIFERPVDIGRIVEIRSLGRSIYLSTQYYHGGIEFSGSCRCAKLAIKRKGREYTDILHAAVDFPKFIDVKDITDAFVLASSNYLVLLELIHAIAPDYTYQVECNMNITGAAFSVLRSIALTVDIYYEKYDF